jgi:general secretion pathway protein L
MFIYVPDLSEFHADTPLEVSDAPPHVGQLTARRAVISDLASVSATRASTAWQLVLPITRISFIDAMLPPVSAQKRQALVQFAIEDKLTVDPASIHAVILGPADSGRNRFVIAAIERAWLARVLRWLGTANINPVAAYAESAFEPGAPREWVVRFAERVAYARRADGLTYLLESSRESIGADGVPLPPPFALTLALNEVKVAEDTRVVPTQLDVRTQAGANIDTAAWQQAIGDIRLKVSSGRVSSVRVANASVAPTNMNLLVGDFAPARDNRTWRALRPAVALGVLALSLQLAFVSVDAWRLAQERRSLRAQMENLFRQTFPEAATIVDPALQMRRNVDALKRERGIAADESQQLLARATALLQLTPGAIERITAIDLRAGELQLRLEAVPDAMRTALRASAGNALIEDLPQAGTVLVRIGGART